MTAIDNSPLRIGVAGLGTVGTSVLHLLTRRADAIAQTCARPVVVTRSEERRVGKEC